MNKRPVWTPADTKRSTLHQPCINHDALVSLDETLGRRDPGVLARRAAQGSSGGFEGRSLNEQAQSNPKIHSQRHGFPDVVGLFLI